MGSEKLLSLIAKRIRRNAQAPECRKVVMDLKEVKKINITRNAQGFPGYRIPLPTEWARMMGIDENNRDIVLELDEQTKTMTVKKIEL